MAYDLPQSAQTYRLRPPLEVSAPFWRPTERPALKSSTQLPFSSKVASSASSFATLPFSRYLSLVCGRFCEADDFPDSPAAPKKVSEYKKPTGVTKRIQSTIFPVSGRQALAWKRNIQSKKKKKKASISKNENKNNAIKYIHYKNKTHRSPSVTVGTCWRPEFVDVCTYGGSGGLPHPLSILIKNDFGMFQEFFALTTPTFLATSFAILQERIEPFPPPTEHNTSR